VHQRGARAENEAMRREPDPAHDTSLEGGWWESIRMITC
jgi:hypothetical protein